MAERVLVTGISGFIAKHVAAALLRDGYEVRGTLRSIGRASEVMRAMAAQGLDPSQMSFVEADLSKEAGWRAAVEDCAYVQHIASPFPIEQPGDREALVPAAREGALRVLSEALSAGVKRTVMTSSMVAMMYRAGRPSRITVSEADWTDPDWPALSAYIVSKTRAEKAAWEFVRDTGDEAHLTTVNPGFVLGPLLDAGIGTSVEVIRLFMTGAYPALPPVSYPVVDVRDLAELHVQAMTAEDAGGRRLIGAGETLSMQEMARALKAAFPDYASKIPTSNLPGFVVRIMARFDRRLRALVPDLGVSPHAQSDYVTDLTGVAFRPSRDAVIASGQSLIDQGLI